MAQSIDQSQESNEILPEKMENHIETNVHGDTANDAVNAADIPQSIDCFYSLKVTEVGAIDAESQVIDASIEVNLRYKASEADSDGKEPAYKPPVRFDSSAGNLNIDPIKGFNGFFSINNQEINYRFRASGSFINSLELAGYPFDVQDIELPVTFGPRPLYGGVGVYGGNKSNITFNYKPETKQEYFVSVAGSCVDNAEWTSSQPIIELEDSMFPDYFKITIRLKVSRKWTDLFLKFIWIIFLITACMMFVFWLPSIEAVTALGTTLILSIVAVQLVIRSSLPKLHFVTYIDKYVIASLIYVILLMVLHVVMSERGIKPDNFAALLSSIGVFIIYNLCFVAYGYYIRSAELSKLRMNGSKLKHHATKAHPGYGLGSNNQHIYDSSNSMGATFKSMFMPKKYI